MTSVMVRYRVKPESRALNETLVRDVYDELQRGRPEGLRYVTFVLEDGVTFVHIASMESADGSNPLASVAAFERFQDGIADRCEEQPVLTVLQEIGSYRLLGSS